MLLPGDLVVPRLRRGTKCLFVWSYDDTGPCTVIGEIAKNTIMTIVKIDKFSNDQLAEEWKDGSCLLLCPKGITGWVGAGWIRKIDVRS
jgi:hypothetical protein